MPDLILLSSESSEAFKLEELAKLHGFRVKSTFELVTASDWLRNKGFDLMWAPASLPMDRQQQLAGLLWQENPLASFIVYDFNSGDENHTPASRLFGADLAMGASALATLEKSLLTVRPRGSVKSENFKIMVVEDLDAPRDIVCTFLESMGFSSTTGMRSGKEALAALEENPQTFSCVLTDIKMPNMTGDELIRLIRLNKKLQHIPIIVLTAYGTVDCLIDCLKAGASGFLVKPPKRIDLSREMGRACRIMSQGSNPRLTSAAEAELLRDALVERGF